MVKTADRRGKDGFRVKQCNALTSFSQGKVFYIELEGPGKMPVLHFGMTGMLRVCRSIGFCHRSA